jgi:ketosteroid isomerase-like protein
MQDQRAALMLAHCDGFEKSESAPVRSASNDCRYNLKRRPMSLESTLNQMILSGKVMDAFEQFYSDDVVMQENTAPPTAGKDANRQREHDFLAKVEQFHGVKLLAAAENGDAGFSEWEYDVTFKGAPRTTMSQVAVRRWKGGKVVHERFYYGDAH